MYTHAHFLTYSVLFIVYSQMSFSSKHSSLQQTLTSPSTLSSEVPPLGHRPWPPQADSGLYDTETWCLSLQLSDHLELPVNTSVSLPGWAPFNQGLFFIREAIVKYFLILNTFVFLSSLHPKSYKHCLVNIVSSLCLVGLCACVKPDRLWYLPEPFIYLTSHPFLGTRVPKCPVTNFEQSQTSYCPHLNGILSLYIQMIGVVL